VDDIKREFINEIKQELLKDFRREALAPSRSTKKPMEFSKILMCIFTVMFVGVVLASIVSWFARGEVLYDLLNQVWLPYSMALAAYYGKSAYENKPKIERGYHGV